MFYIFNYEYEFEKSKLLDLHSCRHHLDEFSTKNAKLFFLPTVTESCGFPSQSQQLGDKKQQRFHSLPN